MPHADLIIKISKLFDISLDELLTKDLSKRTDSKKNEDVVNVNKRKRMNNVFVPIAAQAGYLDVYDNSDIKEDDLIYLDIPGIEGEARTFEISGDSMTPILYHGDFVVCRRVENITHLKPGNIYVVVSPTAGIVAKYIYDVKKGIKMIPQNKGLFQTVILPYDEVKEIWHVVMKITTHIFPDKNNYQQNIEARLKHLEEAILKYRPKDD